MTARPTAHCSRVPGFSISAWNGRVSERYGRLSGTGSAEVSSPSAFRGRPNTATSRPSTSPPSPGSTSSPAASLAPLLPRPASAAAEPTSDGSGPSLHAPFAMYDRGSSSWRTVQGSLALTETTPGGGSPHSSRTSLVIWPRSGTTRSGTAYQRRPLVPLTDAIVSGSWLPTPAASEGGYNQSDSPGAAVRPSLTTMARHGLWPTPKGSDAKTGMASRGDHPRRRNLNDAAARWPTPTAKDADSSGGIGDYRGLSLTEAARRWPTPLARDARSYRGALRMPNSQGSDPLVVQVGGRLNPTWVEWLMGAPLGWTDPACGLSATELSRRSSK
jgi:hypothetical protein